MSDYKRLHPLAILFNVFNLFKSSFYFLFTIIVLSIGDGFILYTLLGLSVLTIVFAVIGFLIWRRFEYSVSSDQIHIKQGLLIRKDRYISKHRIQSIDLTQSIFHRPLGLTRVDVETAGSDKKVDAALSAVQLSEGKWIQNVMKSRANVGQDASIDHHESVQRPNRNITNKELFIAGSTSGSVGVILGLIGLLFSQIENIIPEKFYSMTTTWFLSQAIETIILIALVIVVLLWLLGILGTFIKYGQFQITRYDNELFITRGLLEKKQMTIPLKRIQAVGIEEGLTRQPFGLATIYVVIAGGEIGQTADAHTLLFPIIRKSKVQNFLNEILLEYNHFPSDMVNVPKRSIPYYMVRVSILPVILFVVSYIFYPQLLWMFFIIFSIAWLLGIANYRNSSYGINGRYLAIQLRRLSKETVLVPRRRVQSIENKQHVLHRKQALGQVIVSLLSKQSGSHLTVKELEQDDINKMLDWLSKY
ncbi:PH domain-containing protein [Tenuibacillus multivorans]|uniref:Putative membrane protein n=1 Tax=Tenuibacillus multivorans TaxID=237069 RepID=A0A1H0FKR5_9BACI|nr:PH domain-containing protein [Tenuibacillus multivorans]SDN95275.1 putative membrane protein [Tenuibacillus multivorans]